jgi:hypothetical protein
MDSLTDRMNVLRFLSSNESVETTESSKAVAEYRRQLNELLQLPAYGYMGDYDELKEAI